MPIKAGAGALKWQPPKPQTRGASPSSGGLRYASQRASELHAKRMQASKQQHDVGLQYNDQLYGGRQRRGQGGGQVQQVPMGLRYGGPAYGGGYGGGVNGGSYGAYGGFGQSGYNTGGHARTWGAFDGGRGDAGGGGKYSLGHKRKRREWIAGGSKSGRDSVEPGQVYLNPADGKLYRRGN